MPTPMIGSLRDGDGEEKKLMRLIKKQNNMIERLADRLGEQQRSIAEREKREMEERLRIIELENTIKEEESKRRELERLGSFKKEKKSKAHLKKQPSLLDFFGKMVIAKSLGKDIFGSNSDSDDEEDGPLSTRRHKKVRDPYSESDKDAMYPMIMNQRSQFGRGPPMYGPDMMSPGFRGVCHKSSLFIF